MSRKQRAVEALYLATKRHVVALAAHSGEELWRTKLPHGDMAGVHSLLVRDGWLFVAGGGHVHGLRRADGEIIWTNDLPKLGYQTVILAMESAGDGGSVQAAAHVAAAQAAAAAAAG